MGCASAKATTVDWFLLACGAYWERRFVGLDCLCQCLQVRHSETIDIKQREYKGGDIGIYIEFETTDVGIDQPFDRGQSRSRPNIGPHLWVNHLVLRVIVLANEVIRITLIKAKRKVVSHDRCKTYATLLMQKLECKTGYGGVTGLSKLCLELD